MDEMATTEQQEERPRAIHRSISDPHLSPEERSVLAWRQEAFRKLGINTKTSDVLAESNVDIWGLKRLLDQGCAPQVALDILIGTNAMGWHDHVYTPEWFEKRLKELN